MSRCFLGEAGGVGRPSSGTAVGRCRHVATLSIPVDPWLKLLFGFNSYSRREYLYCRCKGVRVGRVEI